MKAAILALPLIAATMLAAPASAQWFWTIPSNASIGEKEMDRTVNAGLKRATKDACARSLTPEDQRGACPRDDAREKVAALAVSASASAEEAKASAPGPAVTSRLLTTTTPTADDER